MFQMLIIIPQNAENEMFFSLFLSKMNQRNLSQLDCVFMDLLDVLIEKLEEVAGFPWWGEPGYAD